MDTLFFKACPILQQGELDQVVTFFRKGYLVVIPTETVYGLAADLSQEEAIEALYRIKKRERKKPLIALISQFKQLESLVLPPPALFFRLAEHFWPGPLTLVTLKKPDFGRKVLPGSSTIGVRFSSHPCVRQIIDAFGSPLAAPSANLSGQPNPTAVDQLTYLDGQVSAMIDAGTSPYQVASTILSITEDGNPTIIREGALSKEMIEEALKMRLLMQAPSL